MSVHRGLPPSYPPSDRGESSHFCCADQPLAGSQPPERGGIAVAWRRQPQVNDGGRNHVPAIPSRRGRAVRGQRREPGEVISVASKSGADAARLLQCRSSAAWAPRSSAVFNPAVAQQIHPLPNQRT